MRAALLFAAILALVWPALPALGQEAVKVSVDTLTSGRGISKAIVRIVNGTQRNFKSVSVKCAFLHDGKAVDTGGASAENVHAGETVFEAVTVITAPVDTANCRLVGAEP